MKEATDQGILTGKNYTNKLGNINLFYVLKYKLKFRL